MKATPLSTLSGLLAFSAVLTFSGCLPLPSESSDTPFVSSSSGMSSTSGSPAPGGSGEAAYTLDEVSFSDNPENTGSLEVNFPKGMFSYKPIWIDSTHIYLQPGKNTEFGAIANIENKTITQAPAYQLAWNNIAYQNGFVYLSMNDTTIKKMDGSFQLVSDISFDLHPEDIFYSAFYAPTESLYYIEQDLSTGKASLCLKKGAHTETVAELPDLGKKEFYQSPQISPSGDEIFLYRVLHEFVVTQIYFYDIQTGSLTTAMPENGGEKTGGLWMPSGSWIGEQPIYMVYHEHDDGRNSNEILYGNPIETKAQSFYKGEELDIGLYKDELSPWSCVTYTVRSIADPNTLQEKFFYFRDDGTYLSYQPKKNIWTPYVQLSPDCKYLSCIPDPGEHDTTGKLLILPTESMWKPLDWQQIQTELDEAVMEISEKK